MGFPPLVTIHTFSLELETQNIYLVRPVFIEKTIYGVLSPPYLLIF